MNGTTSLELEANGALDTASLGQITPSFELKVPF